MRDYDAFNDPYLAKELVQAIHKLVDAHPALQRPIAIMEVCGTHTMEIGRLGIRRLLPQQIQLLSGPGCPVCVTPASYMEAAIELVQDKKNCLVTFGDLLHVPGKTKSLAVAKAEGFDVRVVTSPFQLIEIAKTEPKKEFIFTAVGFETTVPATAQTVYKVDQEGINNAAFLVAHRIVPPILKGLLEDPDISLAGFLLPGHVSAITGEIAYNVLEEYATPGVITGFASVDILSGILALLHLLLQKQTKHEQTLHVKNMYTRVVTYQGNLKAQKLMNSIYEPCDAVLRGIGLVPGCGLKLRSCFYAYDAELKHKFKVGGEDMPPGCSCGQVLKGTMRPDKCPLFKDICTPQHPIGPCMVSSEGSCAAYFRYGY